MGDFPGLCDVLFNQVRALQTLGLFINGVTHSKGKGRVCRHRKTKIIKPTKKRKGKGGNDVKMQTSGRLLKR